MALDATVMTIMCCAGGPLHQDAGDAPQQDWRARGGRRQGAQGRTEGRRHLQKGAVRG